MNIEEALAEIKRLRDALGLIASIYERESPTVMYRVAQAAYDMRCVARTVLLPVEERKHTNVQPPQPPPPTSPGVVAITEGVKP